MTNRSEVFGRLLKAGIASIVNCEGKKAAIVEDELGQLIGISGDSIQRYKSGHLPPEDRTVEILATAAVQRGYLGREWLQRFLHVARYPFADTLLDRLCPIGPARPRPPRVYHNLPAPTYSQFVMREQAFAEVREGLGKQSAIVLIVGLGGNGKTSLAREAATRSLADTGDRLRFDAVVWVSDKDRPGTTNLSIVLDEIARTLDYPGFTQFEHDEKRREVENLLRRQRVLVVVDNFETITDGALLLWLQNLSEPSKALITAREYRREYRRGGWLVELRGMTDAEAQEFVGERLRRLRIAQLVSDPTQLEPLLVATGGNPKAIEIALGLVKHERRPLQQIVDDLYAARGELFDDLFARAWALLDEAARRVLLVMTFFPTSASSEAVAATADVQGFAFDRAAEKLTDLALIDEQRVDLASMPRYVLHPLVRAFAGAQLATQQDFEAKARARWVEWYLCLVANVGYCWNDLAKLNLLDPEQETIFLVINWVSENLLFEKLLYICSGCSYYYHFRGYWDKNLEIHRLRAEAARVLKDASKEIRALAYHIQLLSKRGDASDAENLLERLLEIRSSLQLDGDTFFEVQHAIALYWRARQNLTEAQKAWQECLSYTAKLSMHRYCANRQWLAVCLYEKGLIAEAQQLFYEALQDAIKAGHERFVMTNKIFLASIDLDLGNIEEAAEALAASQAQALQYQDRASLVDIHWTFIRLHTLRGDLPAVRAALAEAIDLFERLGMRHRLTGARAELARLDELIPATG